MRTPRHIHERFLHFIWRNKYLAFDELKSLDQQQIQILDIGVPNRDAGPDFRNAKIRIGKTLYQGDVEIHHDLADWQKHFHSDDPRYNRVILHVVLRWRPRKALLPHVKTESGRVVPTLVLEPFLTEPIRVVWQRAILDERKGRVQTIKCAGQNDDVPSETIKSWIEKLAMERMELKTRKFDARLKELVDEHRLVVKEPYPRYYEDPSEIPPPIKEYTQRDLSRKIFWEQLLYEGIMEGLGYAKNQEPFLRLARNLSLKFIREEMPKDREPAILNIQAMLLGAAGFLSPKVAIEDPEARRYLHALQTRWRDIKKRYQREILHEADWQFFRLRPQNFPTVRLAAMSFLLEGLLKKDFFKDIIQMLKSRISTSAEKLKVLRSLFVMNLEDFHAPSQVSSYWMRHYKLGGRAHRPKRTHLGRERIDDILLNTIIPVSLLYARIFKDGSVRSQALILYKGFPRVQSNTILATMQSQLLKTRVPLSSAYHQQGTIQLHKFYCVDERCGECEIGKLVFRNKLASAGT